MTQHRVHPISCHDKSFVVTDPQEVEQNRNSRTSASVHPASPIIEGLQSHNQQDNEVTAGWDQPEITV